MVQTEAGKGGREPGRARPVGKDRAPEAAPERREREGSQGKRGLVPISSCSPS